MCHDQPYWPAAKITDRALADIYLPIFNLQTLYIPLFVSSYFTWDHYANSTLSLLSGCMVMQYQIRRCFYMYHNVILKNLTLCEQEDSWCTDNTFYFFGLRGLCLTSMITVLIYNQWLISDKRQQSDRWENPTPSLFSLNIGICGSSGFVY